MKFSIERSFELGLTALVSVLLLACGKTPEPPALPNPFTNYPYKEIAENKIAEEFANKWCNNPSITHDAAVTVARLVSLTGKTDCLEAGKKLAGMKRISLSGLLNSDLISELRPLIPFTQLESIDLSSNNFRTFEPLAVVRNSLPNLKELDLSDNNLVSTKIYEYLPNLEVLKLAGNQIEYLGLDRMNKLKKLDVSRNKIRSISDLPEGLEELSVALNPLTSDRPFSGILKCAHLKVLHIQPIQYSGPLMHAMDEFRKVAKTELPKLEIDPKRPE